MIQIFKRGIVSLDEYANSTYLEEKTATNDKGSMANLTRLSRNLGLFAKSSGVQLVPMALNNSMATKYLKWLLEAKISSSGKVVKKPYINSTALHEVDLLSNLIDHMQKRAREGKVPKQYLNVHIDFKEVKQPYRNAKKGESDVFFPSYDEIIAIHHFEVPDRSTWKALKDAYVLGFFTCARHSDMFSFQREGITPVTGMTPDGETIRYNSLKYYSKKTTSFVEIELDDIALEIINRWESWEGETILPLERISDSTNKMKTILKYISTHSDEKILQDLGEKVVKSRFRGKEQVVTVMPRYEAYAFHTSRHGGACWLLDTGVPIYDVSKMLGHADIKTTERWYAKGKALHRNMRIHQTKSRALKLAV